MARRQPRGHVVALDVFGEVPDPDAYLEPSVAPLPERASAIFRGKFSDRCLRTGEWPALGVHPGFRRSDRPFDRVLHRPFPTSRCVVVHLDDRNPLKETGSEVVDCAGVADLPSDTLYSPYIFMESTLPELRAR